MSSNQFNTYSQYHAVNDKGEDTQKTKLQKTQEEVDVVVQQMKENVHKVLIRDSKLHDLHIRADELTEGANQFTTTTRKVKRKFWWQNKKMIIIIVVSVIGGILIIIGVSVAVAYLRK